MTLAKGPLSIRHYDTGDGAATLRVFRRAVHTTAAKDYSQAQIEAWCPSNIDLADWERKRADRNTVVADSRGTVLGFTDLDQNGYIDMMFVDPAASRRGIATRLLQWATEQAVKSGTEVLRTNASITARPFFLAAGFVDDEEQLVVVRGVAMSNHAMSKPLEQTVAFM